MGCLLKLRRASSIITHSSVFGRQTRALLKLLAETRSACKRHTKWPAGCHKHP